MKKIIAVLLTFLIFVSNGAFAFDSTALLLEKGIISGDEGGLRPYDNVLRGEFAKMLCNTFGFKMRKDAFFPDVSKNEWYYEYITALYERGLLMGDEKGYMNPGDFITRTEMAAILGRITGTSMMNIPFKDKESIPEWATPYVSKLYTLKIITGNDDNTFAPDALLTREESFLILTRFLEREFAGGDGSKDNPYLITEVYQFHNIKKNPFASYRLEKDLDFTGCLLEPVSEFYGTFDGNGHKIVNPSTTLSAEYALFPKIMNGAEVKNVFLVCPDNYFSVTLENYGRIYGCVNMSFNNEYAQYQSSGYRGAIAAKNFGRIENCHNTSLVAKKTSDIAIGSICGYNEGEIIGCINYSKSTNVIVGENRGQLVNSRTSTETPAFANENYTDFAGGDGTLSNPYRIVTPLHFENIRKFPDASFVMMNDLNFALIFKNGFLSVEMFSGSFDGNGYKILGIVQNGEYAGVFRTNNGTIKNLTVTDSKISAEKSAAFVVNNNGVIINCKNETDITGNIVSGIALYNDGSIVKCANTGKLQGGLSVSGICSENRKEIKDCINAGVLEGDNSESVIFGITSGGKTENCISYGDMYFLKSIGKLYPVSDTEYENSYFYNRYESKDKGGLAFNEMIASSRYENTDFEVSKYGFPIIMGMDFSDVKFPAGFAQGDGSTENPYVIRNINDLHNVRMYKESNFVLASDINYSSNKNEISILNNAGKGFRPINDFEGTIDGNGYTIYNLEILCEDEENAGFIKKNGGTVKNLTISDARIEGGVSAGAVCAENDGQIHNVTVRASSVGTVRGNTGGICGMNSKRGMLYGCVNASNVFSKISAGGLCGINNGRILNCTNIGGAVINSDTNNGSVGGICAINNDIIEQCANNGKVFVYSDAGFAACGGICGINSATVINCYNTGEQTGKTTYTCYVGGIVGYSDASVITNCYNIGYSSATSDSAKLGSIVGGGISARMSSCYYDSTLTSPTGDITLRPYGCVALSTVEMTDSDSYKGFNFKTVWNIIPDENYVYPQLKINPHIGVGETENIRDFAGGCGTFENPYKIMTPGQLDNVRKYPGSTFMLLNDIDMNQYCRNNEFAPIGDSLFGFYGTFMGEGHKISNLTVTSEEQGGLFGLNNGEIYNLDLENISFTSGIAGGITCVNTGLIYMSSVTYSLEMLDKNIMLGGIASLNKIGGMIISCGINGQITLAGNNVYFGGIAYNNMGIIAGSYNNCEFVSGKSNYLTAGGITTSNSGTVSDCVAYANMYIDPYSESVAGGISAVSTGNIVNSICTASKLTARQSGGICAYYNSGKIYNCYFRNELSRPTFEGEVNNVYKLTDEELCNPLNFKELDTDSMWYMEEGMYPVLIEAFLL